MERDKARIRQVRRTSTHIVALFFIAVHSQAQSDPAISPPTKTPSEAPASTEDEERPTPVVVPPQLVSEALVLYPELASGDARVVLGLLIDRSGNVIETEVQAGDPPFAQAATEAARDWRFLPATRNGVPVPARIRFEVLFEEPERPAQEPAATDHVTRRATKPAKPQQVTELEVTVIGERLDATKRTLTRAEVRELPGTFGDPFRALEALPGVTPIFTGVPFFFVRGAPPGNVGYFLDGIRVPLLYHLALGPSVINPALVDRVDLYSGGYPARYGRFAGGIVAAETTAPATELRGEGNIRLFDAGALVEAPFNGGRGAAVVGGRYSYTAAALSLLAPEVSLQYWDYQGRISYSLTGQDQVTAFAFGSYDFLGEERDGTTEPLADTTFHRLDFRYEHEASEKTKLLIGATLGADFTGIGDPEDRLTVRNDRISLRNVVRHELSEQLTLRGGIDSTLDRFSVDVPLPDFPGQRDEFENLFPTRWDYASGFWVDAIWQPYPYFTLTPGLRFDYYSSQGAAAASVEPRVLLRNAVTEGFSIVHTFGVAHQPPSFVVPVPGFEVGGLQGGLQHSIQTSSGIEAKLPWEFNASATFFNNVFVNLSDPLGSGSFDDAYDNGVIPRNDGSAIGLEIMLRRPLTRELGGFISYTLSRSERRIGPQSFPASFDRTHVLNAALGYDLGKNWRIGARFVYYSGFPAQFEESYDPRTGSISAPRPTDPPRSPGFFRIDGRLEKRWPVEDIGYWAFVVEFLNATLSREVVDMTCTTRSDCETERIGPVTIPSIGVEAKF